MKQFDEQIQLQISQYLDGTLSQEDRAQIETRLQNDPQLIALAEEDRKLTSALRSQPLPAVQWETLAEQISAAIDGEAAIRMERASWVMRLPSPATLAMAASILLAAGIAIVLIQKVVRHTPTGPGTVPTRSFVIVGPQTTAPGSPPVTEISIGPGGSFARESSLAPYADEIDVRSSRVVIASGITSQQVTTAGFPF